MATRSRLEGPRGVASDTAIAAGTAAAAIDHAWQQVWDETSGSHYWFSTATGVTQWDHPSGKKKPPSTGGAASPDDDVLPAGWERRQHEGRVFFKNVVTGAKQWEHPSDAE